MAAEGSLRERYAFGELLGEGGFGRTLAATDRASGAEVVIKELRLRELSEWKPVELFEREARVLASLDHAGIPRFIESVQEQSEDGELHLYIVSERIRGQSLGALIESGTRWNAAEAELLCRDLLGILAYLHELLPAVIHRDIKPDNIIIQPGGSPVLVDFGAVRDLARPPALREATVLGTPGYMAPEQGLGRSDARSDLYGLGATLAHALTHRHPQSLLDAHMELEPAALANLPPSLRKLLTALTRVDPTTRPASAAQALALLDDKSQTFALPPAPTPASVALAVRPSGGGALVAHSGYVPAPASGRMITADVRERLAIQPVRVQKGRALISMLAAPMILFIAMASMFGGLFTAVSLFICATIGFGVTGPAFLAAHERAAAERLYAHGLETRGTVIGIERTGTSAKIRYSYEVGDQRFESLGFPRNHEAANSLEPGVEVPVFYAVEDPSRSVCVAARAA